MKLPVLPLILYFFAASKPTVEELQEVSKIRGRVQHRTAEYVEDDHKPEPCDGVAGTIPKPYAKLPTAEQAMKKYDDELAKIATATGDQKPKAPKAPPGAPAGDTGGQKAPVDPNAPPIDPSKPTAWTGNKPKA